MSFKFPDRFAQTPEPPFDFRRRGEIRPHFPPDPGQTAGQDELLLQFTNYLRVVIGP
jgi:hypothetical protein